MSNTPHRMHHDMGGQPAGPVTMGDTSRHARARMRGPIGGVGVVLAEVLVALSASLASAHDDYDWIRRRGYQSADGKPCCGVDDCLAIPAERVYQTPNGYSLPDFRLVVPYRQALPSEDGKYWLCMTHSVKIRCFFAPPSAM